MERIVVCLSRDGRGSLVQAARRALHDGGALQVLVPSLEFIDPNTVRDEAEETLERQVPEVPATLQVVTGDASEAILEHASGADAVVLGCEPRRSVPTEEQDPDHAHDAPPIGELMATRPVSNGHDSHRVTLTRGERATDRTGSPTLT